MLPPRRRSPCSSFSHTWMKRMHPRPSTYCRSRCHVPRVFSQRKRCRGTGKISRPRARLNLLDPSGFTRAEVLPLPCRPFCCRREWIEMFSSTQCTTTWLACASRGRPSSHLTRAFAGLGSVCIALFIRSSKWSPIIYGLSGAMWGEISIDAGQPVQRNFDKYRVARIRHVPPIEVSVIQSEEPPVGVGEVGAAPIAPALANAIASASGRRIRRLPFSRNGLDLASAPHWDRLRGARELRTDPTRPPRSYGRGLKSDGTGFATTKSAVVSRPAPGRSG
jgi:hypothetical protein